MGIFDKEAVDKAKEESSKVKGNKIQEPDVYPMTFSKAVVKQSKAGNQMIVITSSSEGFDDIDSYFVFDKKKPQQALKIVGFIGNAFAHDFLPIEDAMTDKEEADGVLKQIDQYIGKTFQAAVSIKEELFEKKEDNSFVLVKFRKPDIWYTGPIEQKMTINKAKAFTPLSGDKLAQWNAYEAKQANKYSKDERTDEAKRADAVNESFKKEPPAEGGETPDDDLPF